MVEGAGTCGKVVRHGEDSMDCLRGRVSLLCLLSLGVVVGVV